MKRYLPTFGIAVAVGLTLASGLIYGWMNNRWGLPQDLLAIGERLQQVPESFGDWQMESSGGLSDVEVEILECAGSIVRTYVNRVTGDRVQMALLVGPAMPISLHTAEICWGSRGYTIRDQRQQVTVPVATGSEQQFWALTFRTNNVKGDLIRVYYGWSDGNGWSQETERRFSLTRRSHLYKVDVVSPLPPETKEEDLRTKDPCREFLKDFVPAVSRYLVSTDRD
jgi:hypothetical protein